MAEYAAAVADTPITKRQEYDRLRAALILERSTFESHWRELADYLKPRRVRFWVSDRNKGDRRNQHIIDSTAVFSARTLQSGLHAGLTSPARPWMKLDTPDPDLAKFGPVKQWLHDVTARMLAIFERSNLYNALPTLYGDMGVFGTGAMGVLEDDHAFIRAYAYPVGSYAVGLDRRGLATTFVRDSIMTVRQLIDEFGRVDGGKDIDWSKFSRTVKTLWQRGQYEEAIEVCWIVTPNREQDPDRLGGRSMPWTSCYFERGSTEQQFLRESGFHRFPVMCPRWDVTGEDTYGTDCPGMIALGDIRALQVLQKRKAQAIEKGINPPLMGPNTLRTQKVSLIPGDMNYVDVREGMQGLKPVHEVRSSISELLEDVHDHQTRIQRAFYEDLFLMLASTDHAQPITAREVDERHEEKLLALGPVLERTNDELLDPLVDRVFEMMTRAGLLPPAPPDLHGVELRVEYTSLMAEAQKLVGVVGQDRFLQSVVGLVQTFPEVRHKVDSFKVVDEYADLLGVNPALVKSDDEATGALQQEQQAIQQQQQAASLTQASQAAKNLGQAPMGGDTALSRLVGGVTSAG